MRIVEESDYYKIYWYDDDETILVGEAYAGWSWSVAHIGLDKLNEIAGIQAQKRAVYIILIITTGAQLFPKGRTNLIQLRNLLSKDPQHEKFTVYVTEANFLHTMLQIVGRLYGLASMVERFRFVKTFKQALDMIEDDKSLG